MFKEIDGCICAPKGFFATGLHIGIRKNPEKKDLALIFSEVPAVAAGVFTVNSAKAAPVILTQKQIKNGILQAIVVNSGIANSCTGNIGVIHSKQMASETAKHLKIDPYNVAVSSTGVIGVTLPIEKITEGIRRAAKEISFDGIKAAEAIMTTDTHTKSVAVEFYISEKRVRIGGIAKGSGMIHPNMATMLSFITTDINISHDALQSALSKVNENTFNMITVDGESSTNDMVLVLANGKAENKKISDVESLDWQIFLSGLSYVCKYLAKEIVRDGEGATKLIEVQIFNALTVEQAKFAARSICRSPLVKTAVFGEDANWGRIVSALGASGAEFDLDNLCVDLESISLFRNGVPLDFNECIAREILMKKNIIIKINLGKGEESATAWGCDLTYDYVKINSSYRS